MRLCCCAVVLIGGGTFGDDDDGPEIPNVWLGNAIFALIVSKIVFIVFANGLLHVCERMQNPLDGRKSSFCRTLDGGYCNLLSAMMRVCWYDHKQVHVVYSHFMHSSHIYSHFFPPADHWCSTCFINICMFLVFFFLCCVSFI